MKRRFTVIWDASAERRLTQLWTDNPAIRGEITAAADSVESTLAYEPASIGVPYGLSRYVVQPPLAILFRVVEEDRQVRVLYVEHWYDRLSAR
jgi:hypothetical protein